MTELKNKSLFYLNGSQGEIYIYFGYCGYLDEDNCASKEEIMDYVSSNQGSFSVSIGVGGINPLNYEQPIQYLFKKKHFIL